MATLQFKGKSAVWNHHLSVPYHTLEKDQKKSLKGTNSEENLIIEADNLLALKSLLPKYQGKIKCIYIDPPYNTGNEGWAYNDKVNSPLIKDWIGKTVGKDDLTKHDKWLCMMTPRLKLLYELLESNGVMFISIDDNEFSYLKTLIDDLFGPDKSDVIVWRKSGDGRDGKMKNTTSFRKDHEYIIVVFKGDPILNKIKELPNFKGEYSNPDNDKRGPWLSGSISRADYASNEDHSNYYTVISPTGEKITRQFEIPKNEFETLNTDNRIYWGESGTNVPRQKIFINEEREITPYSVFLTKGTTTEGKKELKVIFDLSDEDGDLFDNPKPSVLIRTLLQLGSDNDSIILDSYAGSGTTGQAVLDLNKKDSGNRKFILVQLSEKIEEDTVAYKAGFRWIHEITRERAKKVIEKNKYKVGFTYSTLGSAIDAETILSGKLPTYKEFAKYVYYLATGKNYPDANGMKEDASFVGRTDSESIYLIYKQDADELKKLAITLDWAQKAHEKDKGEKIVYAPACYLDDEGLEQFNIKFVSIPYNLFERSL